MRWFVLYEVNVQEEQDYWTFKLEGKKKDDPHSSNMDTDNNNQHQTFVDDNNWSNKITTTED